MPSIDIAGVAINYQQWGEGPPALLLHGLGSSLRDWEFNVEALAAQHRIVACDCRGHGGSGRPRSGYTIPRFAADAAELLERLQAAPAHLVGISMGGMVALALAASRPELARSVVAVNAGLRLHFATARERLSLLVRKSLMRLAGMKAVGRKLGREMFPEPGQEHLRRLVAERWAENHPRCYRKSLQAVLACDLRPSYENISCPLLLIRGELDNTPMEFTAEQLSRLPNARRQIMPGSRHASCVDHPEQFNRLVLEFWQQVEAG